MKRIMLFFLLFWIGCNQSNNMSIIVSNKAKYWDVLKYGDRVYNKPSYCYYFASNGDCIYYSYRNENGKVKRILFDYGDVIYPNTWQLKKDTLQIQGFDYVIKDINKEKIILVSIGKSTDTLILITSVY